MVEFTEKKSSQAAALAVGILLTLVAVVAHRFLPERRLTLDSSQEGAHFYLTKGEDTLTQVDWVEPSRLHFKCRFAREAAGASCGYTYELLQGKDIAHGADLSRYRNLKLTIRYAGSARYLRVAIRNFDPRFSRLEDFNSTKFNSLNLQPKDLAKPVAIDLHELTVPEWRVAQYDLPRDLAQPDVSNAIAISIYLQGERAGTEHDVQVDKVEFSGDWISAESWYPRHPVRVDDRGGSFGTSQWLRLRRQHRELQSEKDKYQKLSTIDGLTKVLNRHGIEQFIASLQVANLPPVSSSSISITSRRSTIIAGTTPVTVCCKRSAKSCVRRLATPMASVAGRRRVHSVCPVRPCPKPRTWPKSCVTGILQTNFIPEDPLAVTASFRVATSPAGGSFEQAFQQADQALYLAKSRGRNCVVAAAEDQMHRIRARQRHLGPDQRALRTAQVDPRRGARNRWQSAFSYILIRSRC